MRLARLSWLIALAAVIINAAVPAFRQQFRTGLRFVAPNEKGMERLEAAAAKLFEALGEDVTTFVERRHPDDPEMLLAAGVIADDVGLLRRAAETANTPVTWATYAETLLRLAPAFARLGSSGVNPADAEAVAEEQTRLAQSGIPDHLTPQQAEPLLSALRSWQEVDPQNALPVALEARVLYGLHRDQEVFSTWVRASRLPLVTSHAPARASALRRLLVARGEPEPEALLSSQASLTFPSYAQLRDAARIALYQGRLAAMRGDSAAAVTWWQSTADLGLHMQESADTLIGFLIGVAVQHIGASPAWRWAPDAASGVPDGPLVRGRFFWGDHHSLYLAHAGEAGDRALLDRLVLARLRSEATKEYASGIGDLQSYVDANAYLGLGVAAAALAALLLLIYVLFGSWSRPAADSATNLQATWQFVLAAALLAPLVTAGAIVVRAPLSGASAINQAIAAAVAGATGFAVLLLAIPPLAALHTRAPGARFRTAWRGNLRRLLPVSIALCSLLALGLNIHSYRLRRLWLARFTGPGITEMSMVIGELGSRWTNPTVPPDAWRGETLPERPGPS